MNSPAAFSTLFGELNLSHLAWHIPLAPTSADSITCTAALPE